MSSENRGKSQLEIQKEMIYEKLIGSLKLTEKKLTVFIAVLIVAAIILIIIYSNK